MKDWEIDFLCMFSENMSDEEVINIIDEIEAEEEARIELADMAREGWR
jgi:predicted CopG family antitoxin|tara:strand:- start:240 stop:383 length:144 start_codon:yes stop_codon:yes gene_type:complete